MSDTDDLIAQMLKKKQDDVAPVPHALPAPGQLAPMPEAAPEPEATPAPPEDLTKPHSLPAPEERKEEPESKKEEKKEDKKEDEKRRPFSNKDAAAIAALAPRSIAQVPNSPMPPATPVEQNPADIALAAAGMSPAQAESQRLQALIAKSKPPTGMAESLASRSGDDDQDEDEDADEPKPMASMPAANPTVAPVNVAPQPVAPAAQPPMDYMAALLAAQKQSNNLAAMQQLGKGAERVGAAIARVPNDKTYLDEMTPQINRPIANVEQQQKLQDATMASQLQKRQVDLAKTKDDPASDISNSYRNILKDNFEGIKGIDNLNATQMEQIFPPLKAFAEQQEARAARQDLQDSKNEANKSKAQDKKDKELDSANSKFVQQVLSVRGDKALNNQKDTIRRVDNAFQVIDNPMWKGNLNNIPGPMVNIVTKDLDSIVSGGASSEAGFKEISNPTLYAKLAKGWSAVVNNPTGAKMGAFIQQNRAVLQDLKNNAQKAIQNKYEYIDKTLGPHIRPDDRENSKNAFYEEFLGQKPGEVAANGAPGPKDTVTVRRKKDGLTKTLSAKDAADYLKDPGFEVAR